MKQSMPVLNQFRRINHSMSRRKIGSLILIVFSSFCVLLFQNFSSSNLNNKCVVVFEDNPIQDVVNGGGSQSSAVLSELGIVESKGQCLRKALMGNVFSFSDKCKSTATLIYTRKSLEELLANKEPVINGLNFVAEAPCGSKNELNVGPDTSHSPENNERRQFLTQSSLLFDEMSRDKSVIPSEEEILMDGVLAHCPGCYVLLKRRTLERDHNRCVRTTVLERVQQSFALNSEFAISENEEPATICEKTKESTKE